MESCENVVSTSKAKIVPIEQGVGQGDIFSDVKYSFIDTEDDDSVEIVEYTFPYAIVVSQSCDVAYMDEFESGGNSKVTKFMPAILMCPIYPKVFIRHGNHLKDVFDFLNRPPIEEKAPYYTKEDIKVAETDQHVRFHALKVVINNDEPFMDNAVVDFKHIFSVPMKYLRNNRCNRVCVLGDIYIDHIINKMAAYLARIGLPEPKIPKNKINPK